MDHWRRGLGAGVGTGAGGVPNCWVHRGATRSMMALTRGCRRVLRLNSIRKDGAISNRGWARKFDDPIPVAKGKELVTLRDAALYIAKLPKAEHDAEEWQVAMEALLLVAEHGGPPMEHSHSSNYIRESESEQTALGQHVRILIDTIGDVVRALFEVLITELSPAKWEWRVCYRYGTTIMGGFERTRLSAKYRGNRALFHLLASGWDRDDWPPGPPISSSGP